MMFLSKLPEAKKKNKKCGEIEQRWKEKG